VASPVIDTAVTPDFQAMTMAQLRAEFLRLAAVLDLANDHRKTCHDLIEKRRARAAAQVKLDELTAIEKDALRDLLTP
jgi:hypothetical protein